jgi:hypothetical protein
MPDPAKATVASGTRGSQRVPVPFNRRGCARCASLLFGSSSRPSYADRTQDIRQYRPSPAPSWVCRELVARLIRQRISTGLRIALVSNEFAPPVLSDQLSFSEERCRIAVQSCGRNSRSESLFVGCREMNTPRHWSCKLSVHPPPPTAVYLVCERLIIQPRM